MPEEMKPAPVFVDNPHAPDVFADLALGWSIGAGVVRVTMGAFRSDHSAPGLPDRVVVIGRLVMPVAGAADLAVKLFDFLQQHGVDVPGIRRANEPIQ